MKKGLALVLAISILIIQVLSVVSVSAADPPATQPGTRPASVFPAWMKSLTGENSYLSFFFHPEDNTEAIQVFAKLFFLALIIVLIYSALDFAKFPGGEEKGAGLRWIIAVITGFLATVLIANNEVMGMLQGYKALGITLTIFFPLLILSFFTFVVATKANPIGIVIQRIMWIIYSVYLFIQAGGMLLLKYLYTQGQQPAVGTTAHGFFKFMYGENYWNIAQDAAAGSSPILILLVVVAIAVFVIFVIRNEALYHWMNKEQREADVMRSADKTKRAQAKIDQLAETTR